MSISEEVFSAITQISVQSSISLGEAVVVYADQADNDVTEVIALLDKTAIAIIRQTLASSISLKPSMRRRPRVLFDDN